MEKDHLTDFPMFKGMYVTHPESYQMVQVESVTEWGSVSLVGWGSMVYGRSKIFPSILSSRKVGQLGFGNFEDDEDKILYHEPKPDDPDHDFYGEIDIRGKYILVSSKKAKIEIENARYMHELQQALIVAGFGKLAVTPGLTSYGENKDTIIK